MLCYDSLSKLQNNTPTVLGCFKLIMWQNPSQTFISRLLFNMEMALVCKSQFHCLWLTPFDQSVNWFDQLPARSRGSDLKACLMQVFYKTGLTNPATTNTEGKLNTNTLHFRSDNTVSSLDPPSSRMNKLLDSFLGIVSYYSKHINVHCQYNGNYQERTPLGPDKSVHTREVTPRQRDSVGGDGARHWWHYAAHNYTVYYLQRYSYWIHAVTQ